MYKPKECILLLLWLSAFSSIVPAATATVETESLFITYDTNGVGYLGFPEASGNTLVFKPYMQLSVPADQQYYYDFLPYAVTLNIQPKAGFGILGYTLTASGSSYVGDDAHLGISGSLTKEFYGASYYSGALTGEGAWSVSQYQAGPVLQPISGDIFVETVNHYSYESVTYVEVPVFEDVPEEVIVGWEPTYDEFGNQNGASPIIETVYVNKIVRYDTVPNYELVYQTSGGSITMDNLTIEVATTVPLPPAGVLLMSGMGLVGWMGRCRRGISHRA